MLFFWMNEFEVDDWLVETEPDEEEIYYVGVYGLFGTDPGLC